MRLFPRWLCFVLVLLLLSPPSASASRPSLSAAYRTLNIPPSSSTSDIKKAYHKQSKLHHPDRCSDEESQTCNDNQARINEAYDRLVYANKEEDNPELSDFFGFSDSLYNLISSANDLWSHIPSDDKIRFHNLLDAYFSSTQNNSLEKDFKHLCSLAIDLLTGISPALWVVFYLILLYNLCAFIGGVWLFIRFWRLVWFVFIRIWRLVWFVFINIIFLPIYIFRGVMVRIGG